jgi:predicted MFS family arabinose efflux permease
MKMKEGRRATGAFFGLLGVAVSTWATLVPFAKAQLGLDEATLGSILLAFGCGTIVATVTAAPLTRRYGSRALLVVAASALCFVLPVLAHAPTPATLAVLLLGFGACVGIIGVAANAQAITVQTVMRRPVMSSFHAMFSLGGLAGAAGNSLLLRLGFSPLACAISVSAALLLLVATQAESLIPDPPMDATKASPARRGLAPLPVIFVGLMTLALYLSEGSIVDWGAVFFREVRGYSASTAALGYAAFSITMAAGRLAGDRIVARVGSVAVVRFGAILAAMGFFVMVFAPGAALGLAGCALIGLGASNVVPTLISASARVSNHPAAAAVSTTVAMGTTGLIAGPAVIGFVAQSTGLAIALAGLAALLLIVGAAADVVGVSPSRQRAPAHDARRSFPPLGLHDRRGTASDGVLADS